MVELDESSTTRMGKAALTSFRSDGLPALRSVLALLAQGRGVAKAQVRNTYRVWTTGSADCWGALRPESAGGLEPSSLSLDRVRRPLLPAQRQRVAGLRARARR